LFDSSSLYLLTPTIPLEIKTNPLTSLDKFSQLFHVNIQNWPYKKNLQAKQKFSVRTTHVCYELDNYTNNAHLLC